MGERLADRVALVTGASSGIGAACVRRFVAEGALVAGLDVVEPPPDISQYRKTKKGQSTNTIDKEANSRNCSSMVFRKICHSFIRAASFRLKR